MFWRVDWWTIIWSDPGWPALIVASLAIVAAVVTGIAQYRLSHEALKRADSNMIIVKTANPTRSGSVS
jgi:hypothetical protein